MDIRYVSPVIFVRDMQASRNFYEAVLGQVVAMDLGLSVEYTCGLSLWQRDHASQIIFQRPAEQVPARSHNIQLFFETPQLDAACRRLEEAGVMFIHPIAEPPWGQRSVRCYDPDGNMVEVGEPMGAAIARFLDQGLTMEEIVRRTAMPLETIQKLAAGANV